MSQPLAEAAGSDEVKVAALKNNSEDSVVGSSLTPAVDEKPRDAIEEIDAPPKQVEKPTSMEYEGTTINLTEQVSHTHRQRQLTGALFMAIFKEQHDVIRQIADLGIVDLATVRVPWGNPLIAAIDTGREDTVRLVAGYGIPVDDLCSVVKYGNIPVRCNQYLQGQEPWWPRDGVPMTPLMRAAQQGNLDLVKLLREEFGASDDISSPEGMTALRYAVEGKNRDVVKYLPSTRAGGFRRWKHSNRKSVRRIKKVGRFCYNAGKFVVWDVPKGICTLAKNIVVELPHITWEIMKLIGKIPKLLWRITKALGDAAWYVIKNIPSISKSVAKGLWKFTTKTIPDIVIWIVKKIWYLLTTVLPEFIKRVAKGTWSILAGAGRMLLDFLRGFVSLLHTILTAIVSLFKKVTLKDIWHALKRTFHFIVVDVPVALFNTVKAMGNGLVSFLKWCKNNIGLLGHCFIDLIFALGRFVRWLVKWTLMVPLNVIAMIGRGLHEVGRFINPKL